MNDLSDNVRERIFMNMRFRKMFWLRIIFVILSCAGAAAQEALEIYAPPTPSSIPFLLAAQKLDGVKVTIFSDHSQAHTLFLRGDAPMLVTGLSVGVNFFKQGVPVRIANSTVSGLTYLVTRDKPVSSFKELVGEEIYLPFEGSPIEEATKFLAEKEGVAWGTDLKPKYAPFPSALELLKVGKIRVIALPEPSATLAAAQKNVFVSFSYKEKWDALTGGTDGYPQVAMFIKADWAARHRELLDKLHHELEQAIRLIADDPQQAVALTKDAFGFPEPALLASLKRTSFSLKTGDALKQEITNYYRLIGQPLDETSFSFFDLDSR